MTHPFGSSPLVAVGADPAGTHGEPITSGSFWPPIDPEEAIKAMRINGSVSAQRLRAALVEGMVFAIEQLSDWKFARQSEGHNALADVPAEAIDGQSPLVARFRRAVYAYAAADLAEHYRSTDATGAGHQRADLIEQPIDTLRRDAAWAISDIIGRNRSTVELI